MRAFGLRAGVICPGHAYTRVPCLPVPRCLPVSREAGRAFSTRTVFAKQKPEQQQEQKQKQKHKSPDRPSSSVPWLMQSPSKPSPASASQRPKTGSPSAPVTSQAESQRSPTGSSTAPRSSDQGQPQQAQEKETTASARQTQPSGSADASTSQHPDNHNTSMPEVSGQIAERRARSLANDASTSTASSPQFDKNRPDGRQANDASTSAASSPQVDTSTTDVRPARPQTAGGVRDDVTASASFQHKAHQSSQSQHAQQPSQLQHAQQPSQSQHAQQPSQSQHAQQPSQSQHAQRAQSSNTSNGAQSAPSSSSPVETANAGPASSQYAQRQPRFDVEASRHPGKLAIRDLLATERIMMPEYSPGQKRTMCPVCEGGSQHEASLSVQIKPDSQSAAWKCFRAKCGWEGGIGQTAGEYWHFNIKQHDA